ncbi:ATP synthase subunit a [Enhygromyxa salina]|uniref:ATP synthase subunit a n=2 Tax=Enhygromyxa salina TaxID=215803 RepID=A0A2S9YC58_9BACT|nr:ATP synthase subunit a [Enhygromyxa salina]
MGDHDTLYTVLMPEFWARLTNTAEQSVFGTRHWQWMMFGDTHYSLVHVAAALITVVFLIFAALRWRQTLSGKTQGVVPPREWRLPAMLNGFVNATYNMSADVMGEEDAKKWLPFIGTLALFIFINNIQGLVPGLLPATDTLKTNLALAVMVFVIYNVVGVYTNGFHYLAHFLGPSFEFRQGGIKFPWLFFLMLPIEIVSHIARPVSLSLRLMGNMLADHKVVGAVLVLVPLLVPVPFMLLGVMVAIIQTVVFTLLSVIYLALALEHAEEH